MIPDFSTSAILVLCNSQLLIILADGLNTEVNFPQFVQESVSLPGITRLSGTSDWMASLQLLEVCLRLRSSLTSTPTAS